MRAREDDEVERQVAQRGFPVALLDRSGFGPAGRLLRGEGQTEGQQRDHPDGEAAGEGEGPPPLALLPAGQHLLADQPDELEHAEVAQPEPTDHDEDLEVAEGLLDEDEPDEQGEHAQEHRPPRGGPPPGHPPLEPFADACGGELAGLVPHRPGGGGDHDSIAHDPQARGVEVGRALGERTLDGVGETGALHAQAHVPLQQLDENHDEDAVTEDHPTETGNGAAPVETQGHRQRGEQCAAHDADEGDAGHDVLQLPDMEVARLLRDVGETLTEAARRRLSRPGVRRQLQAGRDDRHRVGEIEAPRARASLEERLVGPADGGAEDGAEGVGVDHRFDGELYRGPEGDGLLVAAAGQLVGQPQGQLTPNGGRIQHLDGAFAERVAVVEGVARPQGHHPEGEDHGDHHEEGNAQGRPHTTHEPGTLTPSEATFSSKPAVASRLMADDASVSVTPNGPYVVSGAALVVRRPLQTERGEPIAWATGPVIPTNDRYALCRCGQSARKPFCDGTHARVGFDGTEQAHGAYDDRAKRYEGTGITIRDDRSICVHAGFCGTAATNVWKMVRGTDDTAVRSQVIAMIERCPSGALTYSIDEDAGDNEPDLPRQIAVVPDGPLLVTGGLPIVRSDGEALEVRNRVTLCRCGGSGDKPLCDGTHKEVGFHHTP